MSVETLFLGLQGQGVVKPAPVPVGQGVLILMDVKGQKSGPIDGSYGKRTVKGHDKAFQILYCQHQIMSPRDPASGLPTGQRMHKPFEAVARNCKGAVLLWNALCTNENLTDVKFTFWSRAEQGAGTTAAIEYTVVLTNANIAAMDQMTSETDGSLFYRIQLTYEKIEWTWINGGVTAMDNWEAKIT